MNKEDKHLCYKLLERAMCETQSYIEQSETKKDKMISETLYNLCFIVEHLVKEK